MPSKNYLIKHLRQRLFNETNGHYMIRLTELLWDVDFATSFLLNDFRRSGERRNFQIDSCVSGRGLIESGIFWYYFLTWVRGS